MFCSEELMSMFKLITGVVLTFLSLTALAAGDEWVWQAKTQSGHFQLELYPNEKPVPLSKFHIWEIKVLNSQGEPVENAQLAITGGMPGHGHGMPSQPQVSGYLGEGRYKIEGMKFNMFGKWLLLVGVQAGAVSDKASFDILLDY